MDKTKKEIELKLSELEESRERIQKLVDSDSKYCEDLLKKKSVVERNVTDQEKEIEKSEPGIKLYKLKLKNYSLEQELIRRTDYNDIVRNNLRVCKRQIDYCKEDLLENKRQQGEMIRERLDPEAKELHTVIQVAYGHGDISSELEVILELLVDQYKHIELVQFTLSGYDKEEAPKVIRMLLDSSIIIYNKSINSARTLIRECPEHHLGGDSLHEYNYNLKKNRESLNKKVQEPA